MSSVMLSLCRGGDAIRERQSSWPGGRATTSSAASERGRERKEGDEERGAGAARVAASESNPEHSPESTKKKRTRGPIMSGPTRLPAREGAWLPSERKRHAG
eukprot:3208940-Rhodomonas_salina.1